MPTALHAPRPTSPVAALYSQKHILHQLALQRLAAALEHVARELRQLRACDGKVGGAAEGGGRAQLLVEGRADLRLSHRPLRVAAAVG